MNKNRVSDKTGIAASEAASQLPASDKARLFDLLPGLVVYVDADQRIRYINRRYAEARSVDAQASIGKRVGEVAGSVNYMAIRNALEDALSGRNVIFEYDLVSGGGKQRIAAEYVPDFDADGRVVGVLALLTDLTPRRNLQAQLEEGERLFEDAFSNSPIGMALVDTSGHIMRANRSFAAMLQRSNEALAGASFATLTHPDDVDADLFLFRQVLAGTRNGYKIDKRYLRPDGGIVETTLSVVAMRNAAGEIVRFISQIEDVTEQRNAQRRLSEANVQLSLALDALNGGVWHMDLSTDRFETSEQLAHFIAGPLSKPLGLDAYMARMNPADHAGADLMPLITGELDRNSAEYRLETNDGERWMRCDRKLVRDHTGRPRKIVGVAIDITREREEISRSEAQAHADSLTGLLNRRGFEKRCAKVAAASRFAILAIDLDGFKQVNDRHGHAAGDQVLVATARRLQAAVRDRDIVARLGGDEFVVTLVDAGEGAVEEIAERILASVREPIAISGGEAVVGCSIGIHVLPVWPADINAAHARADAALYDAKAAGKNTWRSA
jgi:diguanylate cyclase (GGDEF)-like protein/PAS domain S-box-containing protein